MKGGKESTAEIVPSLKTIQICSTNRLRIDSVFQSIENRFTAVLVSDPISWSIENRFICSLDSPCLADLLIDWESIRLLSVSPLLSWFVDRLKNRFGCSLVSPLLSWFVDRLKNRFGCSLDSSLHSWLPDRLRIDSAHFWFTIRIPNRLRIDSKLLIQLQKVISSSYELRIARFLSLNRISRRNLRNGDIHISKFLTRKTMHSKMQARS